MQTFEAVLDSISGTGKSLSTSLDTWKWVLRAMYIPEYWRQPIFFKQTSVAKVFTREQARKAEICDCAVLRVRFDWYRDCQTVYGPDYMERTADICVSDLFAKNAYRGMSVNVFCQYSRHFNNEHSVRVWLAK